MFIDISIVNQIISRIYSTSTREINCYPLERKRARMTKSGIL